MAEDGNDDDPVVQEFDVFLAKSLAEHLFVFQYPVRPKTSTYDDAVVMDARVKPKQQKVEIDIALDTRGPSYDKSKGEHLAINSTSDRSQPIFNSSLMDLYKLHSTPTTTNSRYAVGLFREGELHLTPCKGVLQLRPSFFHMEQGDSKSRTMDNSAVSEDYSSQGEEDEAKPVTVRFARPESERARKAREKSFKFMQAKMEEEPWTKVKFHHFGSEAAELERNRLVCTAPDYEVNELKVAPGAYLKMLIPEVKETEIPKPNLPNNVISMTQLRSLPLGDQIRSILLNAKVIKFNQLLVLLPPDVDPPAVPRSLQQVAVLIQGCWVVKSEVLYPKDSFSAHSGISAEALCKARDYILWRFTQSASITRKEICSLIKLPNEDLKDILESIARVRPVKGWEFLFPFDDTFVRRYPEVVQRQQMLWDAKHHQLQKLFKLPLVKIKVEPDSQQKAASTSGRQQKRSKSGSESESQADGGVVPRAQIVVKTEPAEPEVPANQLTTRDLLTSSEIKTEAGSPVKSISALGRTIKSEPVDDATEPMEIGFGDADPCYMNGTDQVDPSTEAEKFQVELRTFVLEKLRSAHCITVAALKGQLHYKLAESAPGHVLSRGVSDKVLEEAVVDVGGKVVNASWPSGMKEEPLYIYYEFGDQLDQLRTCLVKLFQHNHKYQKAILKKRIEELMGKAIPDADITKLLRDYCGPAANGYYSLKFTNTLSAQC